MGNISTVLHQVHQIIPRYEFEKTVEEYKGDRYVKDFTCHNQLVVMLYAQASGKISLRDIESGLKVHSSSLYHLGISSVTKSNLSHCNGNRDYRIYEKTFYDLLSRCHDMTPVKRFRFKNKLVTLDSTTIDLCLELFPWAKFRTTKGAIKLHTLFNNRSQIPEFINITDGKQHDGVEAMNTGFPISKDSILVFDRIYVIWEWLLYLDSMGVTFVSRSKSNMAYKVVGQHEKPKNKHCLKDEKIRLTGFYSKKEYSNTFRRIEWLDDETGQTIVFITNNMEFSASTIAGIYKARWQIEIFFKWIKQNLKIKTFLGTSENAVKTQIWIAMIYYLMLCYIKFQTKYAYSLLDFTRIIGEALFMHINIIDLLSMNFENFKKYRDPNPQLRLF